MEINYTVIFLTGFSALTLVMLLIFLFKKLALKYDIVKTHGVSPVGGLAMGIAFFTVCLFSFLMDKRLSGGILFGIAIPALIILIFGVIDDLRALSVFSKFIAQFIAAVLLIVFGIRTHIVYIGELANIIITLIWVIGISNAFNHLDVLDGLAGGTAVIISSAFFIISIAGVDINSAVLSLAVCAVSGGFLIFNLPPAKVYMGNAGSHFLGFLLASIAIAISYAPLERKITLLSPLVILGFPIFDTAFLIFVRIMNKKIPFEKSNDHLVFRFLSLGHSKRKALWIMLCLCFLFSFCGVFLSRADNLFGLLIVIFVVLVSLILAKKMSAVKVNE